MFDNTSFKMLEKGMDAVWYKQKVINQNIANDSTPGYKAKTVTFGAVLDEKCKCRYHVGEQKSDGIKFTVAVTEEPNTQQTLDGNNVDIEKESSALVDAQFQYQTLIDKANNDFSMIRTAIQK